MAFCIDFAFCTASGLYRHYNAAGQLLYVGVTKNFLRRQGEHIQAASWRAEIHHVEFYPMPIEEARLLEMHVIAAERPKYNSHGNGEWGTRLKRSARSQAQQKRDACRNENSENRREYRRGWYDRNRGRILAERRHKYATSSYDRNYDVRRNRSESRREYRRQWEARRRAAKLTMAASSS